jgi:hypothetical protein
MGWACGTDRKTEECVQKFGGGTSSKTILKTEKDMRWEL